MRMLVIDKGTTARTLRETLLSSRLSADQANAAIEHLQATNPHVDLKALKPGTIVFVPDAPAFKRSASDSVVDTVLSDVERLVEGALDAARARARVAAEASALENAELGKTLRSAAFKRAIGQDAELQSAVDAAGEALKQENQETQEAEQTLTDASKAAIAALRSLSAVLRG